MEIAKVNGERYAAYTQCIYTKSESVRVKIVWEEVIIKTSGRISSTIKQKRLLLNISFLWLRFEFSSTVDFAKRSKRFMCCSASKAKKQQKRSRRDLSCCQLHALFMFSSYCVCAFHFFFSSVFTLFFLFFILFLVFVKQQTEEENVCSRVTFMNEWQRHDMKTFMHHLFSCVL